MRDGDVLAALVIPEDLASNLQSTLELGHASRSSTTPRTRPSRRTCENTIEAQVQAANAALTKRIAEEALDLLELIGDGGDYTFLGQDFDVLGLERAEAILAEARAEPAAGLAGARAARRGDRLHRRSRART